MPECSLPPRAQNVAGLSVCTTPGPDDTVVGVVKPAGGALPRQVVQIPLSALTRGETGEPGLSAYQLAVLNGFDGSQKDWLASLHGQDGRPGEKGMPGNIIFGGAFDPDRDGHRPDGTAIVSGDLFLNITTYDAFQADYDRSILIWRKVANIKGPKGDPGQPGLPATIGAYSMPGMTVSSGYLLEDRGDNEVSKVIFPNGLVFKYPPLVTFSTYQLRASEWDGTRWTGNPTYPPGISGGPRPKLVNVSSTSFQFVHPGGNPDRKGGEQTIWTAWGLIDAEATAANQAGGSHG